MASGTVRVVAIVSIGDAFLRVGRSRRLAWSYGLQPLRERPVKIFERHDILAVFEARPTHNQSGVLFAVAAAAHGFGSCSLFKLVKFVHTFSFITDNSTGASSFGGPPVGMRFISLCCTLRRAALGAILSLILCELTARAVRVFEYPAIVATARRREQRLSKSERKMRRVVCFETRSAGRL